MDKETFIAMLEYVKSHKALYLFMIIGGKVLTYLSYVVYPILVIWIVAMREPAPWRAIVVPAVGFVLLSTFRYFVNAPRPYEVFETPSLVIKKTKGKSFPSRHVFSAFIIAFTAFWFYPWLGICLGVCGGFLAISRVLSGVHFAKDVLAGAISGVGLGLIGFLLCSQLANMV